MGHPALIRTDASLARLIARANEAGSIAIDCEFQTEGRYHPLLCLVQIGIDGEGWAVDPRAVDLRALAPLLSAADLEKIVHDGRQDLPILLRATGAETIAGVLDTQIAAAFVGLGANIGYAAIVRELIGAELDKSLQTSDWSRELTDAQIEYALDDVRHLHAVTSRLKAALEARQRSAWAREECGRAAARALTRPDRALLYRKVASTSRLTSDQLGVLREVARWRDEVAEVLDRPIATVASDLALKAIALRPPRSVADLGAIRGLGAGRNKEWAERLIAAVEAGLARPEPKPARTVAADPEIAEGLTSLLGVVQRRVAVVEGIASEVLADRASLRSLAEWHLEGRPEGAEHDVLEGFRRALFGELALRVLSGELALSADPSAPAGIALTDVRGRTAAS